MNERAPKTITNPGSLQNAVQNVIENNARLGYQTGRFVGITQGGHHPDLLRICDGLILSSGALRSMEKAVQTYPGFLTLEDYVARWGREWGFSAQAVEHAKASAETFDRLVGYERWVTESEASSG